jgi:tetratricopeptide (TPR) repeat protein
MAGAAFFALCAAAGAEARAQAMTDAQALDTVKAAERALDDNRTAEAERLARSVSESASSDITISTRRRALGAIAEARSRDPGCAAALPPLHEAAAARNAGEPEWNMLLSQLVECGDYPGAAVVLATLIERFPQSAATLRADTVVRLAPYLRGAAPLSFLVNGGWSDESAPDVSAIRLYLIRVLLAEGRQDQALEAARAMVANARADLGSTVVLLVDKAFDQIVRADPDTFNFDAMSARQLANAFADAAAAPQRLDRIHTLGDALYRRGRIDEAGAVIDNALARIREQREGAAFVDLEERLNWAHDLRSRILWAQGRYEDANAALAEGARAEENGRANVSQTLNFAGNLVDTRKPRLPSRFSTISR